MFLRNRSDQPGPRGATASRPGRMLGASAIASVPAKMLLAGPAAAYNGNAAANYADTYATTENSAFVSYDPDDCTNFVSQALQAGGQPNAYGYGDPADLRNWWEFPKSDVSDIYIFGRPASYSATVVPDLKTFLINSGWGTAEGNFSYKSGNPAPPFTPGSVVTGDVLFYDWGQGNGISHASMQVGIGTDAYGYYGNWVDEHTSNRKHIFWTLRPVNAYFADTTIYYVHVSV